MLKLYNARVLGVLNNNVNGSPTMVLIFCDLLSVIFKFIPKGKKTKLSKLQQNNNRSGVCCLYC